MQSIYEAATLQEFINRMDKLTPASQAQWGKMNVSQMLAHCCAPTAVAVGDTNPQSGFISKLLGKLVKNSVVGKQPFKKNLPTDKSFLVADAREFEEEKARFASLLTRLSKGGPEALNGKVHPFFGKLTPEEWSILIVKHTDHHLRQFGV